MELKNIKDNIYYITNVTNIGVIADGNDAVIIDSGLDDDIAKKIIRQLEKNDLKLKAVISTHSHADHIGGNAYLKAATGAKIISPVLEEALVRYPYLEPLFLFSGAHPLKEMMNRYLMAKGSEVDQVFHPGNDRLQIGNLELGTISLQGHSPEHTGIYYGGVLFCGDSVFSPELLDKHRLPFCMDVGKQLKALEALENSDFEWYIPSHGVPLNHVKPSVGVYRQKVEAIRELSLEILTEPLTMDDYLGRLCTGLEIEMRDSRQYYLNHTIALAYLGWMYETGELAFEINGNILYWKRKGE